MLEVMTKVTGLSGFERIRYRPGDFSQSDFSSRTTGYTALAIAKVL
jgi:hypothetical protein